jgi:hypothetical protein
VVVFTRPLLGEAVFSEAVFGEAVFGEAVMFGDDAC